MTEHGSPSTSSRAVRRNALWNIFGQGFPLLLAVFCIPPLIKGIGTDRFGALTLVWTVLTYFSFFDLGLGRALTQLLATGSGEDKKDEASLIWTASLLLVGMGFIAAVILFLLAPFLTIRLLHFNGPLQTEMILSLRELGLILPILIHSLALKGILEAKRRFDLSNLIRVPLGIFTYGVPLLVLPFSHRLSTIVAILLAGRIIAWILNFWMVLKIVPHLWQIPTWKTQRLGKLFHFGGWVTLITIIAPITDNMDRFFIGSILAISMVAYYTTSFELVSKLSIISQGIGGTIFPEFASRFQRNLKEAEALYMRGFKYLLTVLFPLVLIITVYAHEGLSLWLNPKFADIGGPVLQWLALSMLLAGVSMVSFIFLLGIGRPHIPAAYYLLELPLHAGILYLLLKFAGVRGAAIAYFIRNVTGFLFLFLFSGSILRFRAHTYRKTIIPLIIAVAILFAFHVEMGFLLKTCLAFTTLIIYGWVVWAFVVEKQDKTLVLEKLRKLK